MNPIQYSPHSFPEPPPIIEKSMGVPELLVTSIWKYCNSYYDISENNISEHNISLKKLINNILNPEILNNLKNISINDISINNVQVSRAVFDSSSLANTLYDPETYKDDINQILEYDNAHLSFFNTHGIIRNKQRLFKQGYGGTHQPDSLVAMALLCLSDLSVVKRSIREKFVSNINPTESDTSLKIKHSLLKLYSEEPTNNGEVNTTLDITNLLYNKVDISFNTTKTLEVLCFKLRKNLTYNKPNDFSNSNITICCGFYQAGILAIKYAIDYIDHYQNNSQLNPKQILVCVDRVSDKIEEQYLKKLIEYVKKGNIIISLIGKQPDDSNILDILSCVKFVKFDEKHVYNIRPDLSFNELNISLKNNLRLTSSKYKELLFIGGIDMTLPLYVWGHDEEEDEDNGNELFETALKKIYGRNSDDGAIETISNRVNEALTAFL